MPIPFDRFRLLNGSGKKVDSVKYGTRAEAGHTDPAVAPSDAALGPILAGQQASVLPIIFDVKTVIIQEIVTEKIGNGANDRPRRLENWEIFYPQDYVEYPEANSIVTIDVYVLNMPLGAGTDPADFYAWAHVTFVDGSTWDFYSPQFVKQF